MNKFICTCVCVGFAGYCPALQCLSNLCFQGRGLGVVLGCLLGMFPLFFLPNHEEDKKVLVLPNQEENKKMPVSSDHKEDKKVLVDD